MAETLVSVVVPLYNKEATIARTLASIIGQTYPRLEVIVVDDGSTDAGGEEVTKIRDRRIRLHRQENRGPGAARNFGTSVSTGSLITYLDADDEWEPRFVETAVKILDGEPRCAVFASDFWLGRNGPTQWGGLVEAPRREGLSRVSTDWTKDEMAWCLADFHACSTVYRKEVVMAHGGFFEMDQCTYGEDVYFWIKVRLNETVYAHTVPLAYYHIEASELGIGARRSAVPLEPVFSNVESIRQCCPAELEGVFRTWLGIHAIRAAFLHLKDGRVDIARHLIENFSEMRLWPTKYAHLLVRYRLPILWSLRDRCRSFITGDMSKVKAVAQG